MMLLSNEKKITSAKFQVSVLDMMLGELEFREVYYPSNTHLIKSNQSGIVGDIVLESKYQQFPGFLMFHFILNYSQILSRDFVGLPYLVCIDILHRNHEPLGNGNKVYVFG